jgi:murein L,D-transpeptidase YcbB/YkuD
VSAPVLRPDQASLLLQTLGAVSLEGFPSDAFIPAGVPSLTALSDLLSSDDADDQRRGQGLLKDAIFAYARAQRGFRLKAAAFDKNWGMRPQPYDVQSDFNLALTGDRLAAWVQGLPPPCDRYRGLRDALAKLRAISASGGWGLVRPGRW